MQHNNITLIGMPGCGKSTIGIVLAKHLGYSFIDSDLLIQSRENMLLHEIIEQKGLETFNQIENEVNSSIVTNHSIIATGGSVIYGLEAMMHLKSISTIVYLQLSYEELKNRLGDLTKRGVAIRPGQTLSSLYDERIPYYEKFADITIHCDGKQIRESVATIAKAVL